MRWMMLLAALAGGCVFQSDLVAWQGVSTRELLVHPLFSSLPRNVQAIGNGEELWTYSNCGAAPVVCSPVSGTVICNGGGETCCHNQFFVRGSTVESYRPVGRCRTDCSVRPGGACADEPATASVH